MEARGKLARVGSLLPLHGSRGLTHMVRLNDTCLYPLSHLTGSVLGFLTCPLNRPQLLPRFQPCSHVHYLSIMCASLHCWTCLFSYLNLKAFSFSSVLLHSAAIRAACLPWCLFPPQTLIHLSLRFLIIYF